MQITVLGDEYREYARTVPQLLSGLKYHAS
jgi:hypothetical protein